MGSNLVTAQTVLASNIARYRTLESKGWVQLSDQFAAKAAAQKAGNGLAKLLLLIYLANQLRMIAALVQFRKP